ncbi:hypothetical protein [uncultured Parasutterella sp.]|uniref:hypothetical protein n=1 Tax=uncultured Parasutterella sp. TaxID=1263098 RepID=UPI0034A33444
MTINWRSFLNGLIKAAMYAAFYVAGVLTSSQLSQFTITTQQDRIESLEAETAIQRKQIDELSQRALQNTESLKTLNEIKQDLEGMKSEIQTLKRIHK